LQRILEILGFASGTGVSKRDAVEHLVGSH
jgi:hypothetical protein